MYSKITISGRICTGKSTLFLGLQKELGWPTFSASQFFRDWTKTHDVSLQKAEEQNPHLTRDIDLGMQKRLREEKYLILEGWMAGIMADAMPGVLRILLICDDTERVHRLAKRDFLSEKEARRKVVEREASWTAKLETIYHRNDFFDPKNYNFVIDTTHITPRETLDLVLAQIKIIYK